MKLVNKAICDHLCSLALQLHVHICDFTYIINKLCFPYHLYFLISKFIILFFLLSATGEG